MKLIKTLALAAVIAAMPFEITLAQSPPEKIATRDALSLLSAMRNLDGKPVVVNGQVVMQPWEFKNGAIRLKIASNIAILTAVEKLTDQARIALVMQVRKKYGTEKIDGDPAATEEFSRLYDQVLAAPAPGSQDLARLKASELRLEVNEISVTALSAMAPILDRDQ